MTNRVITGLFLFSLVVRIAVLVLTPEALSVDTDSYRSLAENLLCHGTFGHQNVPTAYRPPLYPLLLTGCLIFGEHARWVIGLLHLVLGLATVGLVFQLGRLWGLERYAILAAALVAVDPILLRQSTLLMTETAATFFATLGLFVLTRFSERPCSTRAVIVGICLGLAALCRPTFLVWAVGILFVIPWIERAWTVRLRLIGPLLLTILLMLVPWTVRNHLRFGRPIVTTTHGGYTLLLGNNQWFYEYLHSGSWGSVWDAKPFQADWARQTAHRTGPLDELRFDRLAYKRAVQNARHEPGSFLLSCTVRVGRLWSPLSHRVGLNGTNATNGLRYTVGIWYLIEIGLAIVGIFFVWRLSSISSRTWLWGLLLLICFSAVHAFYWSNMRMRAPLMPVVALAAAAGYSRCFPRRERTFSDPLSQVT